jgi:hypothetical protein
MIFIVTSAFFFVHFFIIFFHWFILTVIILTSLLCCSLRSLLFQMTQIYFRFLLQIIIIFALFGCDFLSKFFHSLFSLLLNSCSFLKCFAFNIANILIKIKIWVFFLSSQNFIYWVWIEGMLA